MVYNYAPWGHRDFMAQEEARDETQEDAQVERDRERAIGEIQSASNVLLMMLSRVREGYPDLPRMDIRVTEMDPEIEGFETEPETEAYGDVAPTAESARLVITIDADTKEHAEQHGNQLQSQGCACQSTGETQVTCVCSMF